MNRSLRPEFGSTDDVQCFVVAPRLLFSAEAERSVRGHHIDRNLAGKLRRRKPLLTIFLVRRVRVLCSQVAREWLGGGGSRPGIASPSPRRAPATVAQLMTQTRWRMARIADDSRRTVRSLQHIDGSATRSLPTRTDSRHATYMARLLNQTKWHSFW